MKDHRYENKDCWSRTPHYRPGAKLTAEQLNLSQADAVRRDRLVNVAMHGVGVAYGFQIRTNDKGEMIVEDSCIHISCGLAFDRYGRMLFWGGGNLKMEDIIGTKPEGEGREGPYTLSVHYAEKSDQGGAFDPCREGADWVDRCVVFTLEEECKPHDACAPDVPEGVCVTRSECVCMTRREWICTRSGFQPGEIPDDVSLDQALADACAEPPPLSASDCGRVAYDPEAGIPLSCVEICDLDGDKEDCHPRYGFCDCSYVESCNVRPVAYRSRLLYELINQDDVPLAKIASYSWSDWELQKWSDADRVRFSDFRSRAKACKCKDSQIDPKKGKECKEWWVDPKEGFSLMFSRPVQRRTLHPLSVIMDIYILETRANYWEPWRIPTQILHLDENGQLITESDSEVECARGLVICPETDWIKYEIDDSKSTILDCANMGRLARVEISVRGQIVRDCCGLMIDARPPDIDEGDPCGNRAGQERPGDTWISVFRIGPDAHEDKKVPFYQADIAEQQVAPQADSLTGRSET